MLARVAIVLLVSLCNRVRLTARATVGDASPLRRSIVIELGLVVLILGIVAGWRCTPPPRVLAEIEAASAPITVQLAASQGKAEMLVTPGRPGPVTLDIALPIPAEAETVRVENPGQGIAAISRPAS